MDDEGLTMAGPKPVLGYPNMWAAVLAMGGLILNVMGCALLALALTLVMLADAGRADRAQAEQCARPTDAMALVQWHGCAR